MSDGTNACWPESSTVSITAVAEGLLAIERELDALAQQDEALMVKRLHIHTKMQICHQTLRDLLIKSGAKYEPKDWPNFPELHSVD